LTIKFYLLKLGNIWIKNNWVLLKSSLKSISTLSINYWICYTFFLFYWVFLLGVVFYPLFGFFIYNLVLWNLFNFHFFYIITNLVFLLLFCYTFKNLFVDNLFTFFILITLHWNYCWLLLLLIKFNKSSFNFHYFLILFFIINLYSAYSLFITTFFVYDSNFIMDLNYNLLFYELNFSLDNIIIEEVNFIKTLNQNWLINWNFYLYSNIITLPTFTLLLNSTSLLNFYSLTWLPLSSMLWIENNFLLTLLYSLVWTQIWGYYIIFKKS
jgi:hypothetical protein